MYKNILVAVDSHVPASWAEALPAAAALARCFSARLTLCTVVPDMEAELEAEWSPIRYREMLEQARLRLIEISRQVPDLKVDIGVATGSVCSGILGQAAAVQADLIVAAHIASPKHFLLSATAVRVARRADCSVLVVRGCADGEERPSPK